MPLPPWLARVNRMGTNRLAAPVAAWAPGFGVVVHRGRRSGRTYRTPVNLFRDDGGFVIALTYGADSEWVRNVMAAGECDIEHLGRRIHLSGAELITWREAAEAIPAVIRSLLILMNVEEFLRLQAGRPADR